MDSLVEQCTSEKHAQDQWDLILRICEDYATKEPKACLKAIGKRIFHKNPNVSLRAITLLDACSKNCGKPFNRECASRDFTQLIKSKFSNLQRIPSVKLTEIFEKWSEEFKLDSELALAASLYAWVKSEHYDVIRNLLEDRKAVKAGLVRRSAAQLRAKEDEELAKAIALSLKESDVKKPTDTSAPPAASSQPASVTTNIVSDISKTALYPNFFDSLANSYSKPTRSLAKGRVRALYDFEAAEDNELTFKTGELIVLVDDSDENWWRGSNHRGEGLFPAQFVTREEDETDTSKTPVPTTSTKTVVPTLSTQPQAPVHLDGNKLDECLRLINSVDVIGGLQPDPPELSQLEAECYAMAPLVDPELEKVDKRIMMLSDLHERLLKAFEMYHDLMSKSQTPYHFNAVDGPGTTLYIPPSNMIPYGHQQPSIVTGSTPLGYASGSSIANTQTQPGSAVYALPENLYPSQLHFPPLTVQSASGHVTAQSTAYYPTDQPQQFGVASSGPNPSQLTHQQYYSIGGGAQQFITNNPDATSTYEPNSLDFRSQGAHSYIPGAHLNDVTNGTEGLSASLPFGVPAGK